MAERASNSATPEARARLDAFLAGRDRLFVHPTGHPSIATGFCFCDRGPIRQIVI